MGARGPISGFQKARKITGRVVDAPAPPASLGESGREAWTAAFSSAPWLTTAADVGLVRIWGELHDERDELRRAIARTGRRTKGSKGQWVSAPAVAQLRDVERTLMRLAAVLGVGSANAARLGVSLDDGTPREPSELDEIRARRAARRAALAGTPEAQAARAAELGRFSTDSEPPQREW